MKRILVVCTANICRSPMVAGLLQIRLAASGLAPQVEVTSAGIQSISGEPASQHGVMLLAQRHIDIRHHRSTQITEEEILHANLILVMEERHRQTIFTWIPQQISKVFLLSELIGESSELDDPYGRGKDAYIATVERIEQILDGGWERLLALLQLETSKSEDSSQKAVIS